MSRVERGDDDPGGRKKETDPADAPQSWIFNSLNQLQEQLQEMEKRLSKRVDGVDGRLGRVEKQIWIAIGAAFVIGIVVAFLSQIVSFDFVVSIKPITPPP